MKRHFLVILLLQVCAGFIIGVSSADAQQKVPGQAYFGANNYVEYIYGSLPVIVSAPHDGSLTPSNIPDRTDSLCGLTVTTTRDINTQRVVRSLDTSLFILFGQHPHTIISHLHRKKLDVNREIIEGACNDAPAQQSWNNYMDFLDTAHRTVSNQYGRGLFLDMHGHGHAIDRVEIGYLLTANTLRQPDTFLNKPTIIAYSSIRNLVTTNLTAQIHAQLVRGSQAFGTMLGNAGYPSVPSQQIPFPNVGESYFDGGYNTARWASRDSGTIDGFQLETYYTGLRNNWQNIRQFTDSLAVIIKNYLGHMFNPVLGLSNHLLLFKGTFRNGYNELQWQNIEEVKLRFYEVERSMDGIRFQTIYKTAVGKISYGFDDSGFEEGANYYRLKLLNKDGTINYSRLIAINCNMHEMVSCTFNASTNELILQHPKAGKAALAKLSTIAGEQLQSFKLNEGLRQTTIHVSIKNSGAYVLTYCNQNKIFSTKFIKN